MKKKLVVLGKGTAGAQAMAHCVRWLPNHELEWHFDPKVPVQTVGEGSNLSFGIRMFENLGFSHEDLRHVDGTFKTGIAKEGWGKTGAPFFHDFAPPTISHHFNAVKLQDYIFSKLKDKVKIVEHNITSDQIDADFVMDCSGKPSSLEAFDIPKYIPVNAVHVTQCFWEYPRFQHTLTIARPYGWVFGIPLANRCAIGYMYNKDINTLEEVKEDVKYMFEKYNLTPSDTTNTFSFGNYTRKKNFTDRIAYNGNASFFLEPLEATSISAMHLIQHKALDVWFNGGSIDKANEEYKTYLTHIERFIMMHYYAGSPFKTPFWDFAQERGIRCMEDEVKNDELFKSLYKLQKEAKSFGHCVDIKAPLYSIWWVGSFFQNIRGLGIEENLDSLFS